RTLDAGLEKALWARLKLMGRSLMRRAPVGVTLTAPGFGTLVGKAQEPQVTLTGTPGELLLFAFGRQRSARVEASGDPDLVAQLRNAQLGL
ncbi:MAG: TIGR03085 family protein, partial [Acidobacteriota bacterium]|nr:TIGR03085 family protein [Acidobacteriota bacterium]